MKALITILLISFAFTSEATQRNLIFVTIDGLRWQEVFNGKQQDLIENVEITKHSNDLIESLKASNPNTAKELLMPFMWQTIAKNGVLIGDRTQGSNMSVANQWYFSYPGYSEIFTGVVNNSLNSNKKVLNPEVSFLEWLSKDKGYKNVAAFGSWDVFPYILNTERSGLYVNAGFSAANLYYHSDQVNLLNTLQQEIPSPWHNVRLDSFTHRFAMDYLKTNKPRVISISYGETDDFAHQGDHHQYLTAAHRTDGFIAQLWQWVQRTEGYKDNTNLLIITDHGRGSNLKDWRHHASSSAVKTYMKSLLTEFPRGVEGSEHIWMAAIGPDIKSLGVAKTDSEIYQKQISATALKLLGEDPDEFNLKAAKPITGIIK